MAVFIRKERLGSGSPGYEKRLMQKIESTAGFKAISSQLTEAKEERRKALDGKWDDSAEVQHWRTLTKEEKARDAIDRMIPTVKVTQANRNGKECTHEEARKVAENIAYKKEAQDSEK